MSDEIMRSSDKSSGAPPVADSGTEADKGPKDKTNGANTGRTSPERRDAILNMLAIGDLTMPLLGYVRTHKRAFLAHGAKITNIESMKYEQMIKVLKQLPPKAFGLVEEWISKNTKEIMDAFLEQSKKGKKGNAGGDAEHPQTQDSKNKQGEDVQSDGMAPEIETKLAEKLLGLIAYANNSIQAKPVDFTARARLMLACMHSGNEAYANLAWQICEMRSARSAYGKRTEQLGDMLDAIFNYGKAAAARQSDAFELAVLATGVAIRTGEISNGEQGIEAVKLHERAYSDNGAAPLAGRLSAELEQVKPSFGIKARRTRPAIANQHATANTLEVMAQCFVVKDNLEPGKPPYAFSNIIAVRELGTQEWYELPNRDEADRLFPLTGNLIHFSGRNQPELPRRNSLAVWRVEEQVFADEANEGQPTRVNRVKANQLLHHVQQVLVPADISSSEPDLLREWITQNLRNLQDKDEGSILLHLKDGLLIHGAYSEMVKEGFTQQFRAWRGLKLHQTTSSLMLHIGELPATEERYDVTPPVRAAVRALRELQEFTADDKRKLSQALERLGEHQALVERLKTAGVRDLHWDDESIQEVEGVVYELPSVKEKVEAILAQARQEADAEVAGQRDELKRLSDEHNRMLQLIDDKKGMLAQARDDLHSIVVKELERARNMGLKYALTRAFEKGASEGVEQLISEAKQANPDDGDSEAK